MKRAKSTLLLALKIGKNGVSSIVDGDIPPGDY